MGTNLTIENLIGLLLGALLFVSVLVGLYFFMKDYVIDFFKNLGSKTNVETAKIILNLI